ncbi:hypothetical protein N7462_005966 [Penicillium macrosclerotiorum]|uniref:uncharacterized protein n=1 Tax=Penicillium macrosclerotiorum TaxID=303699 RepID=UPI00254739FA|nr:uncharacterized protein N7462_005966 [Penicillium macrosclerotiorum]KAJ5682801.1 hypothetical protein N7462_005966 [Penicillium macrosclerotiorum]
MDFTITKPPTKVMIIGAGFSGLTMACQLQLKLNCYDYIIYDRYAAPGGTWWANKYPGCAVDIPAVFYSLSFCPNPDFSKAFPSQPEVLDYFNNVAKKFDIPRHIVPNTEWEGAYWQDLTNTWLVKLRNLSTGESFYQECKILISAVGGLVNPNKFEVPGVDVFEGDIVHTARWKEDINLEDKDVVVVGNGCSAAQLIPAIFDQARSIRQFIRTPQHYVQNENIDINSYWKLMFRYMPGALWILRMIVFFYLESTSARFNISATGSKARNQSAERSKDYILRTAPEKYWPLLIPTYDMGCKRRIFDNLKYVRCLQQNNIHLTDDAVISLQSKSVLTKSGQEYPADIIKLKSSSIKLLATGFSLTQFDVDIRGREGYSREEHWKKFGYKEAYKSIAMSKFPNFFYILGPNSGKGHTSAIYSIENFSNLVIKVIEPVVNDRSSFVEVKYDKEETYNRQLHDSLAQTIFNTSCGSYFIDSKTKKNWFVYPWSSYFMWLDTHYWNRTDDWIYGVSSMFTRSST